jgi:hypothetical protein
MIVYRVHADTSSFQKLDSANRDPWYAGARYLHFNCQAQGNSWKPPELYVKEPLMPRGDFVGLQGFDPIVVRDSVYQKYLRSLDYCCELLPLKFEGEQMWVINVLKCVNALDPANCTWTSVPRKSTIRKYAFFDYRLPQYPLFKIPETMINQVLLAHGVVHEEYDLKNVCERHGLTGLKFVELWRSDSTTTD